ncbi:MAG: cystathionine beta-lyase [Magnetospirillum sp. WYHS-4]
MKKDTLLGHAGRHPEDHQGIVNPPVYRASTVLFPSLDELETAERERFDRVYYGRYGTPTHFAFEEAVATLEGASHAIALPSGMAAIACTLHALLEAGDHILMTDNAYGPAARLCEGPLNRLGIATTRYDPMVGADIAELMRPTTRLVFTEAPGSLTFEVQDVPAIADAAHAAGALVAMDNTWSAGLYFQPFDKGVDLSIQAATKYIVGHSDAMLGSVSMRDRTLFERLRGTAVGMGWCAGPDDCWLGLRGIRSLSARLARHQDTGLKLARWLAARPEIETVLHPALPSCPGHVVWQRDFTGSSGLFSVVLKEGYSKEALAAFVDGLELFGMGFSWGGYESLILPLRIDRQATVWPFKGHALRIHSGLEDGEDLIADLEKGLARLGDA